jgi:peptidyl-prolyl cis-trans isomerase SurA
MQKKIFNYLLFALTAFSSLSAQDNIIDEIVWIVGDEAILKSDVEEQRMQLQYEGMNIKGDPYCFIPEQLALQKLYLDQAKIDSVYADEKMVSSQADMRINYLLSQTGSKESLEEYFGKSMNDIREELKEIVRNQQIMQMMQRNIIGEVNVTPSEIKRFYNSIPVDSLPIIPDQAEIQIITIEPKISQEDIENVKSKLREFQERVESGDSQFSTLAILYSEDIESAKRGGEIGFMGKGQLVPEYANVAFSLQDPTKVSKIVESEFGYHIIQLIEKQGDRINTRHILMKPKTSLQARNQAKSRLDSVAEVIRSGKLTFEESVAFYSSDKNTKNSSGLMVNPRTNDTKFPIKELSPEIARAISNLKTNEISSPFSMVNASGNEVYAIIKLKSNTKAHTANLTDDYLEIKSLCENKKSFDKLNEWIRSKQETTYVRIDEKWRNCDFMYPGWGKNNNNSETEYISK